MQLACVPGQSAAKVQLTKPMVTLCLVFLNIPDARKLPVVALLNDSPSFPLCSTRAGSLLIVRSVVHSTMGWFWKM